MEKENGWDQLTPVKAQGLYKQIEDQFMAFIRSGELKPGNKLPSERELQERLQVSRSVLREALRVLEAKGMVIGSQGKGRFLRAATEWSTDQDGNPWTHMEKVSLSDIYELRLTLEPAAARTAAARATPADFAALDEVLERMRSRNERDWHEEDFPFHLALAGASHNHMVVRVLRMQYTLMDKFSPDIYRRLLVEETIQQWRREHELVVAALRAKDAERAGQIMYQHIGRAYELLKGT